MLATRSFVSNVSLFINLYFVGAGNRESSLVRCSCDGGMIAYYDSQNNRYALPPLKLSNRLILSRASVPYS
jgi:hypothetical protein